MIGMTDPVLPPFNGGLHCGADVLPWLTRMIDRCSRLSTAGSIAAGSLRFRVQILQGVLPPFNGGLHCGSADRNRSPAVTASGAPAFQRRAPLRQMGHPALRESQLHVCSRLSTAGSIAA